MKAQDVKSGACQGYGPVGHAIGHTVAALPLGLGAAQASPCARALRSHTLATPPIFMIRGKEEARWQVKK